MEQVTTIGLDIAKHVFQVHGADAAGHVLFRKRLARAKLLGFLASQPACVVAMEACAGAHATIRCRRRRRSRGDVIGSVADRADENLMRCRTFLSFAAVVINLKTTKALGLIAGDASPPCR